MNILRFPQPVQTPVVDFKTAIDSHSSFFFSPIRDLFTRVDQKLYKKLSRHQFPRHPILAGDLSSLEELLDSSGFFLGENDSARLFLDSGKNLACGLKLFISDLWSFDGKAKTIGSLAQTTWRVSQKHYVKSGLNKFIPEFAKSGFSRKKIKSAGLHHALDAILDFIADLKTQGHSKKEINSILELCKKHLPKIKRYTWDLLETGSYLLEKEIESYQRSKLISYTKEFNFASDLNLVNFYRYNDSSIMTYTTETHFVCKIVLDDRVISGNIPDTIVIRDGDYLMATFSPYEKRQRQLTIKIPLTRIHHDSQISLYMKNKDLIFGEVGFDLKIKP